MHDLTNLALSDTIQLGNQLRKAGDGAGCMEQAAENAARILYSQLGDSRGGPGCVMARVYKSHRYAELPAELQAFAQGILGDTPADPDLRCLTLLASVGVEPAWNDRKQSRGHKAIPLPSPSALEQLPMVLQLVRQLGLQVSDVVKPRSEIILEREQQTFNVFFVERAVGSDIIPAQEGFVVPFGVESVVGFGGLLPTGDMFAVILFSKVPLSHATAELFKTLALNVKVSLLPFVGKDTFT